ncbi:MAG TPA: SAVMC3_10250 family protein [Solirubrobacterales bacterium]
MGRGRQAPPGDLIYLSERKLYGCAAYLGIDTEVSAPARETEGGVAATLGIPEVGGVSASAGTKGSRIDPGWEEQVLERHLREVMKRIGRLPSLENAEAVEGEQWFRFHREVRFGVGYADDQPSIKALVVVDSEPVARGASVPALLLNGSVVHVRDPYATEELRAEPGNRSGSGSGRLFNWLEEMRQASEQDPHASPRLIRERAGPPADDADTALEMYGAFADRRLPPTVMAEPLMHGAVCEGVARASFVAVGEESTLVMGSPLYVRQCPLDSEPQSEPKLLGRIFGRSAQ